MSQKVTLQTTAQINVPQLALLLVVGWLRGWIAVCSTSQHSRPRLGSHWHRWACARWAPTAKHPDSHGKASWDPPTLAPLHPSTTDGQVGDKRHAPLCTDLTGEEPAGRAAPGPLPGYSTQHNTRCYPPTERQHNWISAGTRAAASKLPRHGHSPEPTEEVNHHHSNNHSAVLSGRDKSACREECRFRLLLPCLARQTDTARY